MLSARLSPDSVKNMVKLINCVKLSIFLDGLSAAVDSGMGSISNIFGSKHYLN